MKINFKMILLYFALSIIPLLFIGTSALISHSIDSEYRTIITEIAQKTADIQMSPEVYNEIQNLSAEKVCNTLKGSIDSKTYNETCTKSLELKSDLSIYSNYAWGVICFGLLVCVLNLLLGWVSKTNRFVLLGAFKIGTFLTFITTAVLILGQCAFGIGIIYYLEAYYIGTIHTGVIFSIALAGGIASIALLYNMFKILNKNIIVRGLTITKQQQPKMWKIIEEITKKMGTKSPDNLIVYFGDNYFVTQAPVVCYSGIVKGRTLVISLPCLYKFTEPEFKAVLVHEFAHFQGLDTIYSMYFFNSWERLSNASMAVSARSDVASILTMLLLNGFMQCFIKPKAYFDRLREERADLNAASVISNISIGSALVKLGVYSLCWNFVEQEKINARSQDKYIVNESKIFNIVCDKLIKNKDKNNVVIDYLKSETNTQTSVLDDHPCLKDRLKYLGINYNKAQDFIKEIKAEPIITVFNDLSKLEEELSKYDATV